MPTFPSQAVAGGDPEIDGEREVVEPLFAMLDDLALTFDVVAPGQGWENEEAE
jgi:alkyl sulfatase BDS1-like metallo-beta-lactamase superfamily hydrolase